jgi:hypothetical protein
MVRGAYKRSAAIHVALNNVAAESGSRGYGALEVHRRARLQSAERGAIQSLAGDISGKGIWQHVEGRQTDSVNSNRISVLCIFSDRVSFNHNPRVLAPRFHASNLAKLLNDSGEHRMDFGLIKSKTKV